jgi:short-subunit dehydrogenase
MLVNNAGYGAYRPFVELDRDDAEALIRVQVVAPTRLARAALPAMIEAGHGAIVNVASMLAFSASLPPQPLPYRATYVGSKAFLVAFSQQLHQEVAGAGVRVQVLCPGIVDTEFHDVVGADRSRFPGMMPAADVVSASLAALGAEEVICLPGVEDAQLIEHRAEAELALFAAARSGVPASRYSKG